MKIKYAFIALALVGCLSLSAQTNSVVTAAPTVSTNIVLDAGKAVDHTGYELTLGGGSVYVPATGSSETSLDVSLEFNPFKSYRNVWIGVQESVAWAPTFAGSTDLIGEYSWHIAGDLWLNTGWTVGAAYDTATSAIYRTGPEATLQYYIGDSAFIFASGNYDLVQWGNNSVSHSLADSQTPLRFSWGIGITF